LRTEATENISQSRKVVTRVLIAASVAAAIAIAPSLSKDSPLSNQVWASVPAQVSDEDFNVIRDKCTETFQANGDFSAAFVDLRANSGLMFLTADRGTSYLADRRYASVLCRFERTGAGFLVSEANMHQTGSRVDELMFGKTAFGTLPVWQFAAYLPKGATRAVITNSQGLTFDASIGFNYALAWWPQHEGEGENAGSISFYDAAGVLIKTQSLNMN
jgi:hypothetical protein